MRQNGDTLPLNYAVHSFAAVATNLHNLMPDFFAVQEIHPLLPQLTVRVTPAIPPHLDGRKIAVSYSYSPDRDSLLFTSAWSRRARMTLTGLSGDRVAISATPWFHSLTRLGWRQYAIRSLVRAVLAALLARMRKALTFAACVDLGGQGALLPAYFGTAKTLTALSLVLEHGAQYLGDDLTIVSDSVGYSFPSSCQLSLPMVRQLPISLSPLRRLGLGVRAVGSQVLSAVVMSSKGSIPVEHLILRSAIQKRTKLTHVFFLQPGPEEIVELDRAEALRALMHVNRYEIGFDHHPVLQIYDYFNARFDLAGLMRQEELVLGRLIDHVEKCLLVSSPTTSRGAELIVRHLAPDAVSVSKARSRLKAGVDAEG